MTLVVEGVYPQSWRGPADLPVGTDQRVRKFIRKVLALTVVECQERSAFSLMTSEPSRPCELPPSVPRRSYATLWWRRPSSRQRVRRGRLISPARSASHRSRRRLSPPPG